MERQEYGVKVIRQLANLPVKLGAKKERGTHFFRLFCRKGGGRVATFADFAAHAPLILKGLGRRTAQGVDGRRGQVDPLVKLYFYILLG